MISSDSEYLSFSSSDEVESSVDSFSSIPSLSTTIECLFSGVAKNFNVIHINAQSIPAHHCDMLASFEIKNLHAILVSETWLKPCLPTISYSLPGFRLIRNDRTSSRGGGVAIYLREHFPFTIVDMSAQPPPTDAGEHLFVEVSLCHTKLLLGVFYSHSSHVNYFDSFEKLLEDYSPSYDHTIIMGDFNTCLLKKDSRSSKLESITRSSNLTILPSNATHFFPNSAPSLLDLIIVSSSEHVDMHGQCAADAFSCHDLVYLSYKIRPPKAKPKILLQRSFGGIDLNCLCKDALEIDWSDVFDAITVDEKVNRFNAVLLKLYDKHAPLRPVKIKHLPAPWLTNEIRSLMHKKVIAKAKLKNRVTDLNKAKYIYSRNQCNRACRNALRQHIHQSVKNEDSSKVWKFLKTLGVGKQRQAHFPNHLDINSLNQHFSNSCTFDAIVKASTLNQLSLIPTPDYSSFFFRQFTDSDVKRSILSISSNAVGSDSVSRNMIMLILDEILLVIQHILNASITSGTFPSIWKEAQIIPLPKKSNPTSYTDYRPISILPFLSKVLERLIHQQLSSFLNRNDLLNPFQSGFRPGHSTVSALVKITDDVRYSMANGQVTVLSLLDFSNAFNNVDFDVLLGLLLSLNISPTVIEWFRSYLHGRRQRIRIDDSFSSWCITTAGVPQGGVLSPLLFGIFINSISDHLTSSYHLYADDLQIYRHAQIDKLPEAIDSINLDLGKILTWSKSYGLSVNPAKTQVIVIGSSRMISKIDWFTLPQVLFDGTHIEVSESLKNLGVIFDRHLSWEPQLAETSRKLFASAGSLRRLRNFLPTSTKTALVQSLLLPILDYADACYLDLTEVQLNKLERLQNFCIRFIFGLRKYDHVSEYRHKLQWLPIRLRRNTHILFLLYTILFFPSTPCYLKERFEFLPFATSRPLRVSSSLMLRTPVHSSKFSGNSFTVRAVRLWNDLPLPIRQAKSIGIFKKMVQDHYLSSAC